MMPSMRKVATASLLALALMGCEEVRKRLQPQAEGQEGKAIDANVVPAECEMPYGLYWVRSRIRPAYVGSWCNIRNARWNPGFKDAERVWWGGTDTYGPDHKANRRHVGNCVF